MAEPTPEDQFGIDLELPPVRFYRANDEETGYLSNLHPVPILIDGRRFSSSEAAYQFAKPKDPRVAHWIAECPKQSLLANVAHSLHWQWDVRPDWQSVKVDRMRLVVDAKFQQHADLARRLLETGRRRLVETGTSNNKVNREWGEVLLPAKAGDTTMPRYVGENKLGRILMEVRQRLTATASAATASKR